MSGAGFSDALVAGLGALRELQRSTDVDQIIARYRLAHPDVNAMVAIDREPGQQRVEHDLLLSHPDGGTVALAWRRETGNPWAVNYLDHWAAHYVVSVGERNVSLLGVMDSLRNATRNRPTLGTQIVDEAIIAIEVDATSIVVLIDDVQRESDAFRQARALRSSADMRAWLARASLSADEFEAQMRYRVRRRQWRTQTFARAISPYFEAHRREFETLLIHEVHCHSPHDAQQLFASAQSIGLSGALERAIDTDANTIEFARVHRTRALASAFAHLAAGELLEPRPAHPNVVCFCHARTTASLDAETTGEIERILLRDWLDQRRTELPIQWHWRDVPSV